MGTNSGFSRKISRALSVSMPCVRATSWIASVGMDIIAALFIEDMDIRKVDGDATRIDLSGIQFSLAAPSPVPLTISPHFLVIVHCPEGGSGAGALEVAYWRDDEQVARNVQPLQVDPGRFSYRLVRAELDFCDYGTVQARARIDAGPVTVVPYTLLPPS